MISHNKISKKDLKKLIHQGAVTFAGNRSLKIYGKLSCSSGRRMKKDSRLFFKDETEAIELGFRPCGHCLYERYVQWRPKS